MAKPRSSQPHWWEGKRGEWYVIAQFALFLLVAFGPRTVRGWPDWSSAWSAAASVLGAVLLSVGLTFMVAGALRLGPANLTALPYPKQEAIFRKTGPYRLVRHPMYSGGILMALGWALWVHGWLTILYSGVLALVLDIKANREERWLNEKFPGYAAYQQRVRKLVPFIY